MTIPCQTCARPSECRKDRRCNNPKTAERAERDLREAMAAADAAARRLDEATKSAQAVISIIRSEGI